MMKIWGRMTWCIDRECSPGYYAFNACQQEAEREQEVNDQRTTPDRRGPQPDTALVYTDYFKQQSTSYQMKNYPYGDRRSSKGRRKCD
jgi:hypothetical protein